MADTSSNGPVFLVVDDDAMVRRLVARGLEPLQPQAVLEVEDGLEAQRVLQKQRVDVVVTDVLMPNMDGRELMKWAQEHCPGPLWIVLSGLDTFDAAVDALHLGAFDFLAKPPEVQRVRVAVRNALDQLALTRDRERLYRELEHSNAQLAEKVRQLENVCHMLEDQAEVINADLARAQVIQRALLPHTPPEIEDWCVESLFRPGSVVGGDFYDIVALDRRHVGIVIADAAGHGVAAAMLSVIFKHRLQLKHHATGAPLAPVDVLRTLNEKLLDDVTAPGAFITAVYILLDRHSGQARMASAGHPPGICNRADGQSLLLERTGPALGLEPDARYEEITFELHADDRLFLYTDGLLEGGPASPTADGLAQALTGPIDDRGAALKSLYDAAVRDAQRDRDDITMILVERCRGASRFDDAPVQQERPEPMPPAQVTLLQGVSRKQAYLSIAGTGTWMRSQAFYETAVKLLKRRQLTIDLGACEYLDSTFLGTVYEIVTTKPDAVRLQRVPPKIRALFEELSMHAVLSRTSMTTEPLPADMQPLKRTKADEAVQGQRMLKAHEILASLSDENRAEFREVVESLRQDLGG